MATFIPQTITGGINPWPKIIEYLSTYEREGETITAYYNKQQSIEWMSTPLDGEWEASLTSSWGYKIVDLNQTCSSVGEGGWLDYREGDLLFFGNQQDGEYLENENEGEIVFLSSMADLEDSKVCFRAKISGGWPGMGGAGLHIVDSGIIKNRIIHTSSTEYTLQNISANCRSTDYLVSPQEGCEEITESAQCLTADADNIWIRDYRCIDGLLYGAVNAERSQKMYWHAHGACGAKLGVSTNYPLAQEVVEREYDCVPPPTSQTDCLAANEGNVWVVVDASISNRDATACVYGGDLRDDDLNRSLRIFCQNLTGIPGQHIPLPLPDQPRIYACSEVANAYARPTFLSMNRTAMETDINSKGSTEVEGQVAYIGTGIVVTAEDIANAEKILQEQQLATDAGNAAANTGEIAGIGGGKEDAKDVPDLGFTDDINYVFYGLVISALILAFPVTKILYKSNQNKKKNSGT